MKALQGYDTIDRVYRAEAQEIGSVQINAGDFSTFLEGTVDWLSAQIRLHLPDGQEIPFRVATVLHKDDGIGSSPSTKVRLKFPTQN